LTPELASTIVNEWPEHDFAASTAAIYLMTDRERPDVDATFFRPSLPAPFAFARHDNASVFTDLWAAALADFYVANPISSCEGIVAQWRASLHGGKVGQFPRQCYEPYAKPQAADRALCRHTSAYTLDDPAGMGPCEMLVAVAVALAKMAQGGRLVLWGPWRDLFQAQVDLGALARVRPDVQLVFTTKMPHSMSWTAPRNWQAVRLNATQELRCAAGKPLRALQAALRPRAVEAALVTEAQRDTTTANNNTYSFCFGAGSVKAPTHETTSLHDASVRASTPGYVGSASSACDYVAAHWHVQSDACFAGYAHGAEPTALLREFSIRAAKPYWRSTHTWHCGAP